MLNPNNDRLDYGQLLSAPDKYKLDFAIGTTYSLDLDALVGASLALGLSEDTDSKIAQNPLRRSIPSCLSSSQKPSSYTS